MTRVEINKLKNIIDREVHLPVTQMMYKDAFVVACFLHESGNKSAARKLLYGVLDSLGFNNRKTYFSGILNTLDGNEQAYAADIGAHAEINKLFRL